VPFLAGFVLVGDVLEAVEAPLVGGDTQEQVVFAETDGLEEVKVVVDEKEDSAVSSSRRMCLWARRPWRRRLRLEAAFPAALRGPVDFFAFSRLALI